MHKLFVFLLLLFGYGVTAQSPTNEKANDSLATSKEKKQSPFNTGFYPVSIFDINLRYPIKYNNYEGLRLGFGGVTNNLLSDKFAVGGYFAYGFKDATSKYSLGGSVSLNKKTNTLLSLYYTDDVREIGTYKYLTDDLVYSLFEPRLVNITQFYKHRTWQSNVQHVFNSNFSSEVRVSRANIGQIEDYRFVNDDMIYSGYVISEVVTSLRITSEEKTITYEDGQIEEYDRLPRISFQATQGIKGVAKSDFNYTKLGLKMEYLLKRLNRSSTSITLEGLVAFGDVPLTHLFHAYPNSPTKDEILQRFSVAGVNSFETMYFGEFFSDKLTTVIVKHSIKPFYKLKWSQPQLVLISRHALGDIRNIQRHQGIEFNTLDKLYSEAGIELNKLILGFGISFAYRYGTYYLPDPEDNISAKFTFNLKL